jgi:hypothetical protein
MRKTAEQHRDDNGLDSLAKSEAANALRDTVLAQGSRKPSWWCSDVGFSMKTIAALALFCSFSGMVFAESLECSSTSGAGDLLACYNRTAPPPKLRKRATSQAQTQDKPATFDIPAESRSQADDMLIHENKKLDAKVKTLCRGC